jgi:hypothetical protein
MLQCAIESALIPTMSLSHDVGQAEELSMTGLDSLEPEMRVDFASPSRFRPRAFLRAIRLDAALVASCAFFPAIYALYLFHLWGGQIPVDDVYFGADPHRVSFNLLSTASDFGRTPFHPFFASLCALFAVSRGQVSFHDWLMAGCALYGVLAGSLTYLAARLWRLSPFWAAMSVLLLTTSGAFAAWSHVPEAHAWGGISCLLCIIGARLIPAAGFGRLFGLGVLFVVATSMVVTNGLVWGLSVLLVPSGSLIRWKNIIDLISNNIVMIVGSIVIGVVLMEILFINQKYLFLPNNSLGQLFHFAHDDKYVFAGGLRDPAGGTLVLGFAAPRGPAAHIIGALLALAALMLCSLSTRQGDALRVLRLLIPAAVVLHSVYDRSEAFICASDYFPVIAIIVMSTFAAHLRDWRAKATIIEALVALGLFNLVVIAHTMNAVVPVYSFSL